MIEEQKKATYYVEEETDIESHNSNQKELWKNYEFENDPNKSWWGNFVDSFREIKLDDLDPNLTPAERTAIASARSPLKRHLKSRHLQMMSIGGAIGTGLFVGSGKALRIGGPAGIIIAWLLIGSMVFSVVQALGELATSLPVTGTYYSYMSRFVEPSFGFAITWNSFLGYVLTMPLELIAAAITLSYWDVPSKYRDGFVALFYVAILLINFFGVRGYGEAEYIFSMVKVLAVLGFIILGIVLICGGGPNSDGYIGAKYWYDPGAFAHGFKGVASVFVTAAFSFAGTETFALAAAETENPRKSLPRAAKQVFWRICLFYLVSLTIISCLVPYTNSSLYAATSVDASASPFVIAISEAGIKGLPSVINTVIMIAVLSVGNTCTYGATRCMLSMVNYGYLPAFFGYIDRRGRPLVALIFTFTVGLLSFLAASSEYGTVFDWLLAISGLSSFFTWGAVCVSHLRFRRALAAQGRSTDELPFVAATGVWGSIYGVCLIFLVLICQFWVALYPVGTTTPNAEDFFESYLTLPVLIFFYVFHKIWKKDWTLFIRAKDIDIDTGRREVNVETLKAEIKAEKDYISSRPFWYRTYRWWC